MFHKESCFPENQTFRESFFFSRQEHVSSTLGLRSPLTLSPYFSNSKQNLSSTGNAGAETVSSHLVKHHVINKHTILAIVKRKLKSLWPELKTSR